LLSAKQRFGRLNWLLADSRSRLGLVNTTRLQGSEVTRTSVSGQLRGRSGLCDQPELCTSSRPLWGWRPCSTLRRYSWVIANQLPRMGAARPWDIQIRPFSEWHVFRPERWVAVERVGKHWPTTEKSRDRTAFCWQYRALTALSVPQRGQRRQRDGRGCSLRPAPRPPKHPLQPRTLRHQRV
jgi:hypothetical protein